MLGHENQRKLRLVVPTDFRILEAMSDGKRQTGSNMGAIIGKDGKYMNGRFSDLAGEGLIRKVGPSPTSGMYEITDLGRAALELRDEYSHERAADWGEVVRELAQEMQDS